MITRPPYVFPKGYKFLCDELATLDYVTFDVEQLSRCIQRARNSADDAKRESGRAIKDEESIRRRAIVSRVMSTIKASAVSKPPLSLAILEEVAVSSSQREEMPSVFWVMIRYFVTFLLLPFFVHLGLWAGPLRDRIPALNFVRSMFFFILPSRTRRRFDIDAHLVASEGGRSMTRAFTQRFRAIARTTSPIDRLRKWFARQASAKGITFVAVALSLLVYGALVAVPTLCMLAPIVFPTMAMTITWTERFYPLAFTLAMGWMLAAFGATAPMRFDSLVGILLEKHKLSGTRGVLELFGRRTRTTARRIFDEHLSPRRPTAPQPSTWSVVIPPFLAFLLILPHALAPLLFRVLWVFGLVRPLRAMESTLSPGLLGVSTLDAVLIILSAALTAIGAIQLGYIASVVVKRLRDEETLVYRFSRLSSVELGARAGTRLPYMPLTLWRSGQTWWMLRRFINHTVKSKVHRLLSVAGGLVGTMVLLLAGSSVLLLLLTSGMDAPLFAVVVGYDWLIVGAWVVKLVLVCAQVNRDVLSHRWALRVAQVHADLTEVAPPPSLATAAAGGGIAPKSTIVNAGSTDSSGGGTEGESPMVIPSALLEAAAGAGDRETLTAFLSHSTLALQEEDPHLLRFWGVPLTRLTAVAVALVFAAGAVPAVLAVLRMVM